MKLRGFYLPFLLIPMIGLPLTFVAEFLLGASRMVPYGWVSNEFYLGNLNAADITFRALPFLVYAFVCNSATQAASAKLIGRVSGGVIGLVAATFVVFGPWQDAIVHSFPPGADIGYFGSLHGGWYIASSLSVWLGCLLGAKLGHEDKPALAKKTLLKFVLSLIILAGLISTCMLEPPPRQRTPRNPFSDAPDERVCDMATENSAWEQRNARRKWVLEARERGFTLDDCREILKANRISRKIR